MRQKIVRGDADPGAAILVWIALTRGIGFCEVDEPKGRTIDELAQSLGFRGLKALNEVCGNSSTVELLERYAGATSSPSATGSTSARTMSAVTSVRRRAGAIAGSP